MNRLINRELKAERQVYIVYPLVKGESEARAEERGAGDLSEVRGLFPMSKVCMVHGQMKPAEKRLPDGAVCKWIRPYSCRDHGD